MSGSNRSRCRSPRAGKVELSFFESQTSDEVCFRNLRIADLLSFSLESFRSQIPSLRQSQVRCSSTTVYAMHPSVGDSCQVSQRATPGTLPVRSSTKLFWNRWSKEGECASEQWSVDVDFSRWVSPLNRFAFLSIADLGLLPRALSASFFFYRLLVT